MKPVEANFFFCLTRALGKFSLEELYLATVPAPFKNNLSFPPDYTKSSTDSSKTPEEVLSFIPG
jgi:hypothetical protein